MQNESLSALDIIQSLRGRVPWDVARRILQLHGIERSRGWQNTVERFEDDDITLDADDLASLTQSLVEHIECGEKLTRFYRADADQMKRIRSRLRKALDADDDLAAMYPRLLSPDELVSAPLEWGKLIAIRESKSELIAVFSGVRAVEFRVQVYPEKLPEDARKQLAIYSELYGIQNRRIQTMDVIRVPKDVDDVVEVRSDFPEGLSAEGVLTSINTLHKRLVQIAGDELKPINLFPVIRSMFNSKEEGDIVEAAFTTQSGSVKHEKMRRRSTSLRDEPYHRKTSDPRRAGCL